MNLYEQLKVVHSTDYITKLQHGHLVLQTGWADGGRQTLDIVYWQTPIIRAFENGRVMLDTGGYFTKSTQEYMNETLSRIGWEVRGAWSTAKKRHGSWEVVAPDGEVFQFENDMSLYPEADADHRVVYAWQDESVNT